MKSVPNKETTRSTPARAKEAGARDGESSSQEEPQRHAQPRSDEGITGNNTGTKEARGGGPVRGGDQRA